MEINDEKGMPYGGMPYDEIVMKLEETDPDLVAEVRGYDPFYDHELAHDDYVRSEILDWSPDETWLESQHPARDPALARSQLNLRYSGGRGPNDYRLPNHPELFMGFTGNDPRGRDVEQPVLAKVRSQQAARARNAEVRMGENVGHGGPGSFIEADRPWSGMSKEYDKKEMQRRMKSYMQWFPAEKIGRPWGRNTVADDYYGLRERERVIGEGDEGLFVPEQDQPGFLGPLYGPREQHPSQGYEPAVGIDGGRVRRVDRFSAADAAPWRNTAGEADFVAQKYTSRAGGGRGTYGAGGVGKTLVVGGRPDAVFGRSGGGRAVNRRVLAEGMQAAATGRRAVNRAGGGDAAHGRSAEAPAQGRTAPELARDIAAAARLGVPDRAVHAEGTVGDGLGRGPPTGVGPPRDRQGILYRAEGTHPAAPHARLSTAEAMVRGLRAGTPADIRMVQGQAVAAGARGTAAGEPEGAPRGLGPVPSRDYGAAAGAGLATLGRPGASADMVAHHYGLGVPGDPPAAVAAARGGGFPSRGLAYPGRAPPTTKRPEFTSHSVGGAVLGEDPGRVFGGDGEVASRGMGLGEKKIRATHLGDGGDEGGLAQEGFGDALDVPALGGGGWA